MTRIFTLYPEERHWWSFNDYGAVLDAVESARAQVGPEFRVLEFGPGSSTLALIEGGATAIDACEDDPHWAQVYRKRLQPRFPDVITIREYTLSTPLAIPAVDDRRYHFALIDGPRDTTRRADVIAYALERADVVMVPAESDGGEGLRPTIRKLARKYGRKITWRETGPLAGGFAILTPKAPAPSAGESEDA